MATLIYGMNLNEATGLDSYQIFDKLTAMGVQRIAEPDEEPASGLSEYERVLRIAMGTTRSALHMAAETDPLEGDTYLGVDAAWPGGRQSLARLSAFASTPEPQLVKARFERWWASHPDAAAARAALGLAMDQERDFVICEPPEWSR